MNSHRNLKVLYSAYPASFNIFGGGEIQLLKTKENLEKIGGCSVRLFDVFNDRLDQYDILHNFQMHPDCLSLFRLAKRKRVKLALSPIYWRNQQGITTALGPLGLARFYSNWKNYRIPTFRHLFPFKNFLEIADIVLPNSKMEAAFLSTDFRVEGEKFWVVPNGVDERFAAAQPDHFAEKYGVTDFVLFVGRVMRRKNVLGVIHSCRDLEMPLIVIGNRNPGEEEYFAACVKTAQSSKNIRLIGFLSHNSEELESAYAAAKVVVLPSDYETPGLSALEGGLAGCNLVVTRNGSTTEYFGEHAWYVNPFSTKDLKTKIKEAYEQPKSSALKKIILENYTWQKVAEKTLEAYHLIGS